MDDSPMDADPKLMNATCDFENKQDDKQPNDQKLKQILQDLDDDNQPEDMKMKREVEDLKIANLEGREEEDRVAESLKGIRITESPAVIVESPDASSEALKLIEEIVEIYGHHVDHVILEAKYRNKDEQMLNIDRSMCGGEGETFAQKIKRLGSELEGMRNDKNKFKEYLYIEPRIIQIMGLLLKTHEIFDPCSKSRVSSLTNEELRSSENSEYEMDQFRRGYNGIRTRIDDLKALKMYWKTLEARKRYYKI